MIIPGIHHRFSTPAKINLFLRIQHKRPDNYHELLLDFLPISLFDQIELRPARSGSLELETNQHNIDIEENLVVKAVRLLEREIGQSIPVKIKLEKHIPSGAGLGGGSGNAAGMLVILNRILNLSMSDHQLAALGMQIGADVPFFVSPRPSLGRGIGELLSPIHDFGPLYLLLIYPDFSISTAEAYGICHISGGSAPLSTYNLDEICSLTPEMNDFWIPLAKRYPKLESYRSTLMKTGSCAAGLSGSGSTVFGVFRSIKERDLAAGGLEKQKGWEVYRCQTLQQYTYPLN